MSTSDTTDRPAPWVCPWGICNHDEAQACRREMHPRNGCGGRFPPGTTSDEAKRLIGPRVDPQESAR